MKTGKLGVIGGMGPQATIQFYQRIVDRTEAQSDQEHLPMLLLNDTQMPDRTAALLLGETGPVRARLLSDAKMLEEWGATAIAVACNTAHAFLPEVEKELKVPIVNMVAEAAGRLKALGAKRVAVLATDGTIGLGLYHKALEGQGIEAVSPGAEAQRLVMDLIYGQIKKGGRGDPETFAAIDEEVRRLSCGHALLACTELSSYKDWHSLPAYYVDAMDALVDRCIRVCGYRIRENG